MNISDRIEQIHSQHNKQLYHYSSELPDDAIFPDEIIAEKIDKLSENLKEPLERQIKAVESIADSAKKTANSADIKGWIAIIISALALFLELFLNRAEVINFIISFFQK